MDEAMTNEVPVIRLDNVTKRFGNHAVIENCSVSLYPNHIYGMIGRSGVGKSTLLRLMMGIYLPTSGECRVCNEKPPRMSDTTLERIGYVHQEDELINWFTGAQFLSFIRAHYSRWNEKLLKSVLDSLEIVTSLTIKNLSPGERQCLAFAAAIAHEPDILILDEPASALDPLRRERFLKILLEYASSEGRMVLISSHLLGDLDRTIDHLLVVHNHHILCDASLDVAKSMFVRMVIWTNESDIKACGISRELVSIESRGSSTSLVVTEKGANIIRRKAEIHGWPIDEGAVSLEETFQFLVTAESASKSGTVQPSIEVSR